MSREPDEEFMSITEASVLVLEECPSSQWLEDDEARLSPPRGGRVGAELRVLNLSVGLQEAVSAVKVRNRDLQPDVQLSCFRPGF